MHGYSHPTCLYSKRHADLDMAGNVIGEVPQIGCGMKLGNSTFYDPKYILCLPVLLITNCLTYNRVNPFQET